MESLSEAMARLTAAGYDHDLRAEPGGLVCNTCGMEVDGATVSVDARERFEGPSNPDDESILFALSGPGDHKALYAPAYGPQAAPEDADAVRALSR